MTEISEIIVYVAKSGVFALLFTMLLAYILRDSKGRENKYQKLIESLTKDLNIVTAIAVDVVEIKRAVTFTQAISRADYTRHKEKTVC